MPASIFSETELARLASFPEEIPGDDLIRAFTLTLPSYCAAASKSTPGRLCSVSTKLVISLTTAMPPICSTRSSTGATNRAFKDWNVVFPNATCIVSLLDRLTHHADITVIQGESYRRRESEQEAAARRKQD